MVDEITTIERAEQHALCISKTVGTMKLGKVMGPAYLAIMEHLKKQDIEMSEKDIPFTIYKNLDWDKLAQKGPIAFINMMFVHKWDMDIGIPCPESATGDGSIKKIKLEAGKFVRAIHRGPYMKVGDTYLKIRAYAAEQNILFKNYSIEFYLNDPREVKSADLETEVFIPIS